MEGVWADLAKLQDPDGFVNHISEVVQREHQRREDPDGEERRGTPLCRCDLSHHVCETKQGEVPAKIRTQDLQYIQKPSSRELARKYIQEHPGDVIIREAMESFRNLRANIYAELSSILALMMGAEPPDSADAQDTRDAAREGADTADGPSPSDTPDAADTPTASADGGEEQDVSEMVDAALASAVERHGTEALAEQATEGALSLAKVVTAYQNGDVSTEELQAVADGERSLSDLNLETDGERGDGDE